MEFVGRKMQECLYQCGCCLSTKATGKKPSRGQSGVQDLKESHVLCRAHSRRQKGAQASLLL